MDCWRRSFDIWPLVLMLFCIIFVIGLCASSKDVDHNLSKGNEGDPEDLKLIFNFEPERQDIISRDSKRIEGSKDKNGNLREINDYIVQDEDDHNEPKDDGYIVQEDKLPGTLTRDSEPKDRPVSSKLDADVNTPNDRESVATKRDVLDEGGFALTGRKDVYHYGNAPPQSQGNGKVPTEVGSSDEVNKKTKLSTWEKAQLMMMKRNQYKMKKEAKIKDDQTLSVDPLLFNSIHKASDLNSSPSRDVKTSEASAAMDVSGRNEKRNALIGSDGDSDRNHSNKDNASSKGIKDEGAREKVPLFLKKDDEEIEESTDEDGKTLQSETRIEMELPSLDHELERKPATNDEGLKKASDKYKDKSADKGKYDNDSKIADDSTNSEDSGDSDKKVEDEDINMTEEDEAGIKEEVKHESSSDIESEEDPNEEKFKDIEDISNEFAMEEIKIATQVDDAKVDDPSMEHIYPDDEKAESTSSMEHTYPNDDDDDDDDAMRETEVTEHDNNTDETVDNQNHHHYLDGEVENDDDTIVEKDENEIEENMDDVEGTGKYASSIDEPMTEVETEASSGISNIIDTDGSFENGEHVMMDSSEDAQSDLVEDTRHDVEGSKDNQKSTLTSNDEEAGDKIEEKAHLEKTSFGENKQVSDDDVEDEDNSDEEDDNKVRQKKDEVDFIGNEDDTSDEVEDTTKTSEDHIEEDDVGNKDGKIINEEKDILRGDAAKPYEHQDYLSSKGDEGTKQISENSALEGDVDVEIKMENVTGGDESITHAISHITDAKHLEESDAPQKEQTNLNEMEKIADEDSVEVERSDEGVDIKSHTQIGHEYPSESDDGNNDDVDIKAENDDITTFSDEVKESDDHDHDRPVSTSKPDARKVDTEKVQEIIIEDGEDEKHEEHVKEDDTIRDAGDIHDEKDDSDVDDKDIKNEDFIEKDEENITNDSRYISNETNNSAQDELLSDDLINPDMMEKHSVEDGLEFKNEIESGHSEISEDNDADDEGGAKVDDEGIFKKDVDHMPMLSFEELPVFVEANANKVEEKIDEDSDKKLEDHSSLVGETILGNDINDDGESNVLVEDDEHAKDSQLYASSSHDEDGLKGKKDEDSDHPGASDYPKEEADSPSDSSSTSEIKCKDGAITSDSQGAENVDTTNEYILKHEVMPDTGKEKHAVEAKFDSESMGIGLNKTEETSEDQESLGGLTREMGSTSEGKDNLKEAEHKETRGSPKAEYSEPALSERNDYGDKMNGHENFDGLAKDDKVVEVVMKDGKGDGMDNVFKRVTEVEGNRESANIEESKEEILVAEVVEKYFEDPIQAINEEWKFFTIKPYINLLKTVVKKLDPAITNIIFMLPPSLQSLFLRAPLNMYPTHAFLLFTMSCLSLFAISISRIFRGDSQHSKNKELRGLLFEAKGAVLLKQIEKDEISQELQEIMEELKQKEAVLENGTVEMNRNLKAIIKECDSLKEDVSKKMELSKETRNNVKKVDSDILKQSHVSKELQKSIASIKNQLKQIQDKRDELQSSLDESDLNSIKLEEKIQSLHDEFQALEDSFKQLSSEVQAKDKEAEELKENVDALKLKCSQRTNHIQTREIENEALRRAILQLRVMKVLLGKNSHNDDDGNDDDGDIVDGKNEEEQFDIEEKIKHLSDTAQLRNRADEIEKEKNALMKSLSQEVEAKVNLNDELKKVMEEMERLEQMKEAAEQRMVASTTKIDVLSSYYKDREREYLRMLQEKEAKERAMTSQMKSADEKYKEVEKMANDYKNRVENLKKELEIIHVDYGRQIEAQEKRLHENMASSRQAERDYEWKKQEASIMRERLLQAKDRIKYLHSKSSMQKSSESLNSSINKEDGGLSRTFLQRENMSSPSELRLPSFPPFPPRPGTILPPFMNRAPPPPWLLPPMMPSFPLRPREDSPALDRFRDLPPDDSLDERDRFSFSSSKSPTKLESSPLYRNRFSPPPALRHDPNAKSADSHYPDRGLGSQRTMNNV